MVQLCGRCDTRKAALRRPKTFEQLCRECFYEVFEDEVHQTIVSNKLFKPGEKVAIGASGGKDSTVLAHLMTLLNRRHDYGLHLFLLSIDEGITGYRDDSLETVKRNEQQYQIPLEVVSYKQLYGWTMDEIVKEIGTKNNCTFCGVFRRQALDRGATMMKADKVATGHNADDIAETVLLNILRGDLPRLSRCAAIITGEDGELPRVKPFKYTYQKEIVMYAYFKKLDYFSTECIYAPFAARGLARDFVKDLEATRPRAVVDLIHSAETFRIELGSEGNLPQPRKCERCGYICSQSVCKACQLLEGLNKGLPSMGISRPGQVKSRTATKLAASQLRAMNLAEVKTAADRTHSDCGKARCQCAGGDSEAVSQPKCRAESEQSTASGQRASVDKGLNGDGVADDSCQMQSNGYGCHSSNVSNSDVLQLPQHSGSAAQSTCDGVAACGCASASAQSNAVLCASNEDWTLSSNLDGANDGCLLQGSNPLESGMVGATAGMKAAAESQAPLRVHGKLYESNLRQVDAHPSARKSVRADFGTSW